MNISDMEFIFFINFLWFGSIFRLKIKVKEKSN